MLYKIDFTKTSFALLAYFHPDIKKNLKGALKELKMNPSLGKYLKQDLAGFQTYRLKRYRIIYKTINKSKTVRVYYIGHRRDVYELFNNLLSQQ